MSYDNTNIFARILRGELPCKKAYENEHVLAFHDIRPAAPVHVLVIPTRHIAAVRDAKGSEGEQLLGSLLAFAAAVATEQGLDREGYRIVTNTGKNAGQSVDHLHLHLLGGRKLTWPPG